MKVIIKSSSRIGNGQQQIDFPLGHRSKLAELASFPVDDKTPSAIAAIVEEAAYELKQFDKKQQKLVNVL